jgi:hypothetical protein
MDDVRLGEEGSSESDKEELRAANIESVGKEG